MNAPVDYIEETRRTYDVLGYPSYRWVHSETPPEWAPLIKPLSESVVGLVASGGIYQAGQIAFHYKDDLSYRIIDTDVPTDELRATHFAYDLRDAREDINVVFPIDGLRDLAGAGEIGGLGPRAYTFMGGIYSARKVREDLAAELSDRLVADGVDVVLLVPV